MKIHRCHSAALGPEVSLRVSPLLKLSLLTSLVTGFFSVIWTTTSLVRICQLCLPFRRGERRFPNCLFGGIEYFHTHMLGAGNFFLLSKSKAFGLQRYRIASFFFPDCDNWAEHESSEAE